MTLYPGLPNWSAAEQHFEPNYSQAKAVGVLSSSWPQGKKKCVSIAIIHMFNLLTIFTVTTKQASIHHMAGIYTPYVIYNSYSPTFFLVVKETGSQSLNDLPKIT